MSKRPAACARWVPAKLLPAVLKKLMKDWPGLTNAVGKSAVSEK